MCSYAACRNTNLPKAIFSSLFDEVMENADSGMENTFSSEQLLIAFRQMKEAERNLEEVLFQAQNKLKRCKNSEGLELDELVRYAHYISIDHSVAAPLNWEQGDPRRCAFYLI